MAGKYRFKLIDGEREETRDGEPGFWTLRRWFDLRGYQSWQDFWHWWMEEEPAAPDNDECQMGLF